VAIPLAILCALALTAAAASLFALFYAKALVREANRRTSDLQSQLENALQASQSGLEELSTEVRDLRREPGVAVSPGMPRPGFNLTTRSQVLRLHRRGETAQQIAKVMAVPRQEVELLLKVHGIVLDSMNIPARRPAYPPSPAATESPTLD
jgi:hypothetical protein